MKKNKGCLYLIPTPLKKMASAGDFHPAACSLVNQIRYFIAEEEKTARRHLLQAGFSGTWEEISFFILNEQTRAEGTLTYLMPALQGYDMALLSEAGLPCVADPGAVIVQQAHQQGIRVCPLPGPSSIFLALMASGFSGQNFAFNGYLPVENKRRDQALKELERFAYIKNQTQIFIETPYRNERIFEAVLRSCRLSTLLCIAVDLTLPSEKIHSMAISKWKSAPMPDILKRPAVFLISRPQ